MRRLVLVAIALIALTSCGDTRRPEGIVERWLQSLDQGKAGNPETYAPDVVSEQVLPGFRDLDPGQLDVIEVGKSGTVDVEGVGCTPGAAPCVPHPAGSALVPFRVEPNDGRELRGYAELVERSGTWQVIAIDPQRDVPLPSNGGLAIGGVSSGAWFAGALAALVFAAVALLLMALVRRSLPAEPERS